MNSRGTSLIEAMAALVILTIGLLGGLDAVIIASNQNSIASRMAHVSAIATQVRGGLQSQGYARLVHNAVLTADASVPTAPCTSTSTVTILAGGLDTLAGACVIDLDAYEQSATGLLDPVTPGYSADDFAHYRRILVQFAGVTTGSQQVAVVVSFVRTVPGPPAHFVTQFAIVPSQASNEI